jgi:hypothetical protein
MKGPMSMMAFALVLIVLAAGCASHGSTEPGSAMPRPDTSVPTKSDLAGTWRGSFGQVMTGDSGLIQGEIESQIKDDGTYTTTWITQLVAGSARAGRLEMAGTVVANGSHVMFNDARSGSRMTLKRDGDTLYGVTIDPATRRVTVAVELHRVTAVPQAP